MYCDTVKNKCTPKIFPSRRCEDDIQCIRGLCLHGQVDVSKIKRR